MPIHHPAQVLKKAAARLRRLFFPIGAAPRVLWARWSTGFLCCALALLGRPGFRGLPKTVEASAAAAPSFNLIPKPVSLTVTGGSFVMGPGTAVFTPAGSPEAAAIGRYLAAKLAPATGYTLSVRETETNPGPGHIRLTLDGGDPDLGEEGYLLAVTPQAVTLTACRPAGLFRGVQTIRQLLPAAIAQPSPQPGPWLIPGCRIKDYPRFPWRGAMLDVARHFFSVRDVQSYLDLLAYYKLNRLHLHLSDDQGWRLMIDAWPRLATVGGATAVGGGRGGYFTKADYAEIVAYAWERYIVVVPEIETPGHVQAALAAYAELNDDGRAARPYTGTRVGFSALNARREITYRFLDDVIGELAALTPGPYLHLGGDETFSMGSREYIYFVTRVQRLVRAHGKRLMGWGEIAQAKLGPTAVVQYWASRPRLARLVLDAARRGAGVVVSIADRAYMDMKYVPGERLGNSWAGYLEAERAYAWEPTALIEGLPPQAILGVEAPLWTETLDSLSDLEYMTLPRLPGYAEIGWSSATGRGWEEYRLRLGAQGPRWEAMGVSYHRSPQVPWE